MSDTSSISERDLRRLLDVVSPEASADQGAEIPEQVMRGLAELIPCASVSFFVMDTRRGVTHGQQQLDTADLPDESDEDDALFFAAYWDWGTPPARGSTGGPTPRAAGRGVRCAPQRVVVDRPLPRPDPVDLAADRDHRVAERSSSARFSLSVGSTISVPATGKDIVGAWKP
jgi:hypothetical protein